jgi:hypothetical protein
MVAAHLRLPGTRVNRRGAPATRCRSRLQQRRLDGHDAAALQLTLAAVRRTGALVPRGLYRFASFEEAEAWMMRTMARTHVSRSPTISSGSPAR